MAQTVSFVGLGSMGAGMARSLVRNEFTVRGYDIRAEPLERLAVDGGQPCRSAADAGNGASVAVVIVLTADQAEQAIFGEHGLAETLSPGSVVVCMSTMSPARTIALAERAAAIGLGWLDAPVSGGTVRADEGTHDDGWRRCCRSRKCAAGDRGFFAVRLSPGTGRRRVNRQD